MNNHFFKINDNLQLKDILNYLKITEKSFFLYNPNLNKTILKSRIKKFSSLKSVSSSEVCFVSGKNDFIKDLVNGICIVEKKYSNNFNESVIKIVQDQPKLSFSKLLYQFVKKTNSKNFFKKINNSYICKSVKIGKNVKIGPFCFIKNNVIIKDNTVIEDRVTIHENCIIGKNCHIRSGVVIECSILENNVKIEQNSVIGKTGFGFLPMKSKTKIFKHIAGVYISKLSKIGSNCNIDRGFLDDTYIGKAVMIDNQVHIGHNCYIDDYCALAGKCGLSGSVKLGKNVIFGGGVGIGDNLQIGDNSLVSGGSKIYKSFPKNSKIGGHPAQNLYDWQKIQVMNKRSIKKTNGNQKDKS